MLKESPFKKHTLSIFLILEATPTAFLSNFSPIRLEPDSFALNRWLAVDSRLNRGDKGGKGMGGSQTT